MSSSTAVAAFQKEISRQERALKDGSLAQARLNFIVNAMRQLNADAHFVTLLRAEGMQTAPAILLDRVELEAGYGDR